MKNLTQGKMSKGGVNNPPISKRPEAPPAQPIYNFTNQEAIEVLQKNYPPANYTMLREAIDLAIKALKQS